MKKILVSLALVMVLVTAIGAAPAAAATGQTPAGTCPPGFELHEFMDHTDHEMHIGLTVDLNGNGLICVKHLDTGLHVHADDVVRQASVFNIFQWILNLFNQWSPF